MCDSIDIMSEDNVFILVCEMKDMILSVCKSSYN